MQTLPQDVHKGMRVFDRLNHEIGKVEDFRFSENEDNPEIVPGELDASDRYENDSLVEDVARAFVAEEVPEALRERLLTEGYIRLDTKGLFAADRYILPDQIVASTGDSLMLSVTKDELTKAH